MSSTPSRRPPDLSLFGCDTVLATPHIAGSTEEAQEIVGVRIAEQMVEYLKNGVAINAVNMPALSPEQYRASALTSNSPNGWALSRRTSPRGNPTQSAADLLRQDRRRQHHLIRNAGLAGVLNRWLPQKANLVNAMQIADASGLNVVEAHEKQPAHIDSIRLELETDAGITTVEGSVVLGSRASPA